MVRGGSAWSRGVCSQGNLPSRGGSAWSGGGVVVCTQGGGIPACTEADPPVNRMNDRCKNFTLATTLLRPVTKEAQLSIKL